MDCASFNSGIHYYCYNDLHCAPASLAPASPLVPASPLLELCDGAAAEPPPRFDLGVSALSAPHAETTVQVAMRQAMAAVGFFMGSARIPLFESQLQRTPPTAPQALSRGLERYVFGARDVTLRFDAASTSLVCPLRDRSAPRPIRHPSRRTRVGFLPQREHGEASLEAPRARKLGEVLGHVNATRVEIELLDRLALLTRAKNDAQRRFFCWLTLMAIKPAEVQLDLSRVGRLEVAELEHVRALEAKDGVSSPLS